MYLMSHRIGGQSLTGEGQQLRVDRCFDIRVPISRKGSVINRLKHFYTYARGLRSKMDEPGGKKLGTRYDAIGISETWRSEDLTDKEFQIQGFFTLRENKLKRKGDGVL